MRRNSVLALAALAAIAAPVAGNAAMMYASSANMVTDGPRGTADGRDDITNAFGTPDGDFFELGYGGVFDFQFGTPTGQPFRGPGSLIEITFNDNPDWVEAVRIEVGLAGDAGSFKAVAPEPFVNTQTVSDPSFTFSGIFDTVRLTDVTLDYDSQASQRDTGGFDLDSIGVSPIPLPAAVWVLLGGLGGLAALRRTRA